LEKNEKLASEIGMNTHAAHILALQLLEQHQLFDWSFSFDRATVRFGCCHYQEKKITLSRILTKLNEKKLVQDTILHEIAHALAGKDAGHKKEWKKIAQDIGANPQRCYDTREVRQPLKRYTATCPSCSQRIQMTKKKRIACLPCCRIKNKGRYSSDFHFHFTENH